MTGQSKKTRQHFIFFLLLLFMIAAGFSAFRSTDNVNYSGLLLLFTGSLALARLLWLFELPFTQRSNRHSESEAKSLPIKLISNLSSKTTVKEKIESWASLHSRYSIGALLLLFYCIWASYLDFNPALHPARIQIYQSILDYMNSDEDHFFTNIPQFHNNPAYLAGLLLTGSLYWICLTFAHIQKQSRYIFHVCLGFFIAALVWVLLAPFQPMDLYSYSSLASADLWQGYGWGQVNILVQMDVFPSDRSSLFQLRLLSLGIPGTVILYSIGLLQILIFIHGIFISRTNIPYTCLGFFVLFVLACVDLLLVYQDSYQILWVFGWLLLACLSAISSVENKKRYTLVQ